MPNSERIESLISPEALKQFDQLNQKVESSVATFEQLIAKGVALNKELGGAKGFKELAAGAKLVEETEAKLAKAQAELIAIQEKLRKAREDEGKRLSEIEKQQAKLNATYTDEAKKIAELKIQQQEQNKLLKDQAKEALGLSGAYDKLTKEYNEAAKAAKDLAAQFGAESKQAQEASKRALELDARLKAADANVGRFNKNVGNYSGALNTLQKALQDVSKKIDDNTKSGQQNAAVMEALQKEQGLLQSLLDVQSKGFANATSEIRNNQQAILLLSQVYGEDSAVVAELTKKTATLVDTVGDMKAQIKAQASDTHVFDGLINAAQTLAGVYGAAQGVSALFGDQNEDLQKTMVKLQAVLAVLSGLQGIQNALQKESAVRLLITNGLEKIKLAQKYLETAAESKNIVVKYAAIAAQKALNIATSAAGGPLLLLIGLLALAVTSFAAYGNGAEDAAKQNDRLNKSLEDSNKNIDKGAAVIKARGDKVIAQLEDNFATQEELRKQREKSAQEELDNIKRINDSDIRNREKNQKTIEALESKRTKRGSLNEDDAKALEDAIKIRDGYLDNANKQVIKENELDILRLQNSRTTKEEIIKAKQDEIDVQKTQLQTSLQLQQSIAGNERKTQQDRISALQESRRLQEQIINKDANSKLLNPELTPSQIKVIEAQRTAALTQARRESNKAIEDLNRSYAERERKARFDIIKTEIEDQIKADDLIAQNEKNGFDKRLDALYDGYTKRRDIIIAQHDLDIKNDTLTAEERIAIEKKYASDINGLTVDYGLQQQQLYQQNQDKINEIIAKGQQARQDKIAGDAAGASTELVKQLVSGQITLEQYNKQREDAEHNARVLSLKEEVDNATAKVLATKEGTAERYAAEKDLKEKTKDLNEEYYKKEIEAIVKLNDLKKDLAGEAFSFISDLQGKQFDKESAQIQAQIDEVDRKAERDKTAAELAVETEAEKQARLDLMARTGITAAEAIQQEKATRIAKIDAAAQNQKENLERRQRQLDLERARFEKAANIAQIISTTATAIIEALKTYKGTPQAFAIAATIGTIGAINLAKAIATPLPKFAEGTEDAPGGLAWVGDAYKKELVITPQGRVMQTPAVPTVMNVPRHSIVLPDARAAMESGLAVNKQGRLIQMGNPEINEVGRKIDTLTKVIRNKPVLNMSANQSGLTAIWNYGANWVSYTEDQTRF